MKNNKERRTPYSPEQEELEKNEASFEGLARKHGLRKYDTSPLFRTTKPAHPERVFAGPEEIARSKGYTIEDIQEDNMDIKLLGEKLIADLESPEDKGSSTRNAIAGTLKGIRKTSRPLHNITNVIDRIDNKLDHPAVSDEDANQLVVKQAHYSDAADLMYRKGIREDRLESIDALVEGAFANWVRTMTNRASKNEKSDAKYGRSSPADLAKEVVSQGPGSVRDLVGGQGRKPNYDAPTLLRDELKRTVGKDEGGNTKFTPYRPFAPSRKVVGPEGKAAFMGSPGSFVDNETGLKYSASGGSVAVAGVKDTSKVAVALDPSTRSSAKSTPYRPFAPRNEVSPVSKDDAAKRTNIYKTASYKSIRGESIEQTEKRLISEMKASVVKANVKGGPMTSDASHDFLSGVHADVEKVAEAILEGSTYSVPDGAMGAYTRVAQAPGMNKSGFASPPPPSSRAGQEVLGDTDRPTIMRNAALGDKKAEATIQGVEGQTSGPALDPNRKSYVGAEHTLSRSDFLGKPYMQILGPTKAGFK